MDRNRHMFVHKGKEYAAFSDGKPGEWEIGYEDDDGSIVILGTHKSSIKPGLLDKLPDLEAELHKAINNRTLAVNKKTGGAK